MSSVKNWCQTHAYECIIKGALCNDGVCAGRRMPDGRIKPVQMNLEHSPADPAEARRILERGGRIAPFQIDGRRAGPLRVWAAHRDAPGLCMSRSLGDFLAASVGVVCTPHVAQCRLCPEDLYLIVMSDGVFEFMSNQEIVDYVHDSIERRHAPLKEVRFLINCTTVWPVGASVLAKRPWRWVKPSRACCVYVDWAHHTHG